MTALFPVSGTDITRETVDCSFYQSGHRFRLGVMDVMTEFNTISRRGGGTQCAAFSSFSPSTKQATRIGLKRRHSLALPSWEGVTLHEGGWEQWCHSWGGGQFLGGSSRDGSLVVESLRTWQGRFRGGDKSVLLRENLCHSRHRMKRTSDCKTHTRQQ